MDPSHSKYLHFSGLSRPFEHVPIIKILEITSFLTIRRLAASPQEHCRFCTDLTRSLPRQTPALVIAFVRPRVPSYKRNEKIHERSSMSLALVVASCSSLTTVLEIDRLAP
ncbi:unnamed protein product, partial [Brugia timori]